jgi:Phosphotransferase enzyme family
MVTGDPVARANRAVAAAVAAGRDLGLTVTEPRVLYDFLSVVVHLAPAPVVVRVPTVLPRAVTANPAAQAAQQRRELAVAGWLADQGHPVVAPSPLVPRVPVARDGFSMTFWELVDQVPGVEPDVDRRFTVTAHLHAALCNYPADLAFLMPLDASIPDGLAQLKHHPELLDTADLDRAQQEWALLKPILSSQRVFEAAFPDATVQPIHGDAPFYNLIVTPAGELYSDFEHVTLGPVEWDLAGIGPDGRAVYDAAAAQLGLRPSDERLLRVMGSARMMQLIACLPMALQLPTLAGFLRPFIDHWRRTPLAGGGLM